MREIRCVAAAMILQEDRLLVSQRSNGQWEFPGGKVEPGENPRQTVKRELMEELALEVECGPIYEVLWHTTNERSLIILLFLCRLPYPQEPKLMDGPTGSAWVRIRDLDPETFLPAGRAFLHWMRKHVSESIRKADLLWDADADRMPPKQWMN